MAHNFFGSFTRAQWYDFRDFSTVQKHELEARRRWISAELARTGRVQCSYDEDNNPVSFEASPKSYIGKLLLAYRMLGGVPEHDMLLRTRDQVVFLNRGTGDDSPAYTNGRVYRGSQRFDRTLGLAVESMKGWQLEAVKAKREHLEYKIKRALDYADQLEQEDVLLKNVIDGFYQQIMKVESIMSEPDRYNIPSGIGDRHGLAIGVPGDGTFDDASTVAAAGNQRVPQG